MSYRSCLWAALLLVAPLPCLAQQEYEITIPTTLGDTTETFWLQIPAGYQPGVVCPLLIGWHTLDANHLEFRDATDFDSVANARGWIAASHDGPIPIRQRTPCHWNNHAAQSHVVDVIHWIENRFSVDSSRIYMVGASMGGAAGMVFSNNHLDPLGPMIAAAASVSGIQDCERRYYEQGINYSMISAFRGSPGRAPFTYHRNSAIYFADSTQSMHFNATHLPLWLTFGHAWTDSIWRLHAEDLYAVMVTFADTVVLRESANEGHGWPAAESDLICDFFENFAVNRYPLNISINADENGRWYWADIARRDSAEQFARFEGQVDTNAAQVDFAMMSNVASAKLNLLPTGFPLNQANAISCSWAIQDGTPSELVFAGVTRNPVSVHRNGQPYSAWTYNPRRQELRLEGEGSAEYDIIFNVMAPAPVQPPPHPDLILTAGPNPANPFTVASIELQVASYVGLSIYDISGRLVTTLDSGWRPAGVSTYTWNAARSASGVYVIRLVTAGEERAEKIVVTK